MTQLQMPAGALMQSRLKALTPARLLGMRRGIEKESLRVRPNGSLALTPHPAALGSALTHPGITTDFCESQVELVTGAHRSAEATLEELTQLHQLAPGGVFRALLDGGRVVVVVAWHCLGRRGRRARAKQLLHQIFHFLSWKWKLNGLRVLQVLNRR